MSEELKLEVFLIRKGGVPYDFVVRGKGKMGSGLSEIDCKEIIHRCGSHKALVDACKKIHTAIGKADPIEIGNACAQYVIPALAEVNKEK